MPKATITYDLDDPYEREHHKYAMQALDVRLALNEFVEWIRREIDSGESLEYVFDKLFNVFDNRGVDWEVY